MTLYVYVVNFNPNVNLRLEGSLPREMAVWRALHNTENMNEILEIVNILIVLNSSNILFSSAEQKWRKEDTAVAQGTKSVGI